MKNPEILIKKYRGDVIESMFRGHVVVVDRDGKIEKSIGDHEHYTYIRSASKPFQSIPLITTGTYKAFGLSEKHLAVASGSHNGQKVNTDVVFDMLTKAGLTEDSLKCGTHPPFTKLAKEEIGPNFSPINNNCSGKHASMLLICKHMDWDLENYFEPEHPVQKLIKGIVSKMCEYDSKKIKIGIDGCGVPVFAMPIYNMALGFRNLIYPEKIKHDELKKPVSKIVSSIQKYPDVYAGPDRIASAFIKGNPSSVFKAGADGVGCFGFMNNAAAFKMECGDDGKYSQFLAYKIAEESGANVENMSTWGNPDILANTGIKAGKLCINDKIWG